MPRILYGDLETYHPESNALRSGSHVYAQGCEVMLLAWAVDDGPVCVWDLTTGAPMPAALREELEAREVRILLLNAAFDRACLREALGLALPISRWWCSMAHAHLHSLPGGLDKLCEVLRLPQESGGRVGQAQQQGLTPMLHRSKVFLLLCSMARIASSGQEAPGARTHHLPPRSRRARAHSPYRRTRRASNDISHRSTN